MLDWSTERAELLRVLEPIPHCRKLNLLGLVERCPKQPTLEVRALPGSLDADATLARIAHAEAFLSRVLSR